MSQRALSNQFSRVLHGKVDSVLVTKGGGGGYVAASRETPGLVGRLKGQRSGTFTEDRMNFKGGPTTVGKLTTGKAGRQEMKDVKKWSEGRGTHSVKGARAGRYDPSFHHMGTDYVWHDRDAWS